MLQDTPKPPLRGIVSGVGSYDHGYIMLDGRKAGSPPDAKDIILTLVKAGWNDESPNIEAKNFLVGRIDHIVEGKKSQDGHAFDDACAVIGEGDDVIDSYSVNVFVVEDNKEGDAGVKGHTFSGDTFRRNKILLPEPPKNFRVYTYHDIEDAIQRVEATGEAAYGKANGAAILNDNLIIPRKSIPGDLPSPTLPQKA